MNVNLNAQKKKCHVCDKENESESKFCKFCGNDLVASNFQPFEISQTMMFRIGCFSSCCIIFMVLLVYFSLVVFPSIMPPAQAAITGGLLLPILGGASFIGLIYMLIVYRGASSRRIFSISPKGTIELEKSTGDHNNKNYRFYFTKHGVVYGEILIKGSLHFSGINCRTIVSQLQKYAAKMNKQFIGGKRRKF